MATDTFTLAQNDYDAEIGTQVFNVLALTAVNFDAQAALQSTYIAAALEMTIGQERQSGTSHKSLLGRVLPASSDAQREKKWLISIIDGSTSEVYTTTLPCADLSLLQNNSSYIIQRGNIVGNDAGSKITNFVAAFEAYYVTKIESFGTIWDMQFVGRNL